MSDDEPRRELSRNCREAKGKPNSTHVCTGGACGCRCHETGAPADFRERVERGREEA
jgi:hypothetical protein